MGKLIVIDGADGAGKTEQTKRLHAALSKTGTTTLFDFPRYDATVFGKLLKRCLKKDSDLGDFLHLHPMFIAMPYMLDRATARDDIRGALARGHVVCNRFVPSNLAYGLANLTDPAARKEYEHFVEQGEYEELKQPRPDLVLYLHVPVEISAALTLQKHHGVADQYEENRVYQQAVVDMYLQLCKQHPHWHSIACAPKGTLLPPEEVHALVLKAVQTIL